MNNNELMSMNYSKNQVVLSGSNGQKFFCTGQLLGKGSFSKVYRGYIQRLNPVAIKKIRIDKIQKNKPYLESEIKIMRNLNHKNIVNLIDVIWKDNQIYLVLEDCGGGDLKEFLTRKGSRPMIEKYVQFYMKQLAEGLRYLRSKNIIHRDLKPQNLLLTSDYETLKISDFGFAKVVGSETLAETLCGSPLYMAPEIMNPESKQYTSKADLWSVGIIMYEMLYACYPYKKVGNVFDLIQKIKKYPIEYPLSPKITEKCMNLLKGLLRKDPKVRIDWNDFFDHPWFEDDFGIRRKPKKEDSLLDLNIPLSDDSELLSKYNKTPSKPIIIEQKRKERSGTFDDVNSVFNFEMDDDDDVEKPEFNSLHFNSTSPFIRADKPQFKMRLIDDYSSNESSVLRNRHQVSEPVLIMHEQEDLDQIAATTGGYSLGRQVKDIINTSVSLLKDSFRSFQSNPN